MKVALIGATGFVGSHILKELASRGHQVTAIARHIDTVPSANELVTPLSANVLNSAEVASAVEGHDAVISSYNPGWTNPNIYNEYLEGAQAIQQGVKQAGIKRILIVGGAGSLEIAPGVQLIDSPNFPAEYKPGATAARDYLNILKQETELEWTFLSPAIEMHPGTSGQRTGQYRTGKVNPVFNDSGRSIISAEDLSLAIVDEIEHPAFVREHFTVAY